MVIVLVNGQLCKPPLEVKVDDFIFRRKNTPRRVFATAANLPGLNTLGISVSHSHLIPGAVAPPHIHPRATEVVTVIEGFLTVGFVSYNQSANTAKLYSEVLSKGDSFVYPQGLVHFMYNAGAVDTVTTSAFSSQNPGWFLVTSVLFNTDPPMPVELLSKALKINAENVKELQSKQFFTASTERSS